MKNLDYYRTDLLVENEEMVRHQTESETDRLKEAKGIEFNETRQGRIVVTEVKVDEAGEKRIGKKRGTYVTLTVPTLTIMDIDEVNHLSNVLIEKLDSILQHEPSVVKGKILFIGLGNRDVTPDAVGPLLMDKLQDIVPDYYSDDGSEVFVYAPGVTSKQD